MLCTSRGFFASLGALIVAGCCMAQAPVPFVPDDANERSGTMHNHVFRFVEAFNGDFFILQESQFTEAALEAVSIDDLRLFVEQTNKRSGGFLFLGQNVVDETHIRAWLRGHGGDFIDLDMDLIIEVEKEFPFRIQDINFAPAQRLGDPMFADWDELDEAAKALDFSTAMTVLEIPPDGGPDIELYRRRGDERVAIGPGASLYLMQALVDELRSGDRSWLHEMAISDDLKSLPASQLGRYMQGTFVETSEVALRMMQYADNAGFDHLVHEMGRDVMTRRLWASIGVEENDARALSPFLTTRELYSLKCQVDTSLVNRYANAPPEEQWAMLEGEVKDAPVVMELFSAWETPRSPDTVGWFSTTDALASVMSDLWRARLEPEMAVLGKVMDAPRRIPWDRRVWTEFWLELNGEPGAMSGVWAMERRSDGRQFVIAVVANSKTRSLYDAFSNDAILGAIDLLEHAP